MPQQSISVLIAHHQDHSRDQLKNLLMGGGLQNAAVSIASTLHEVDDIISKTSPDLAILSTSYGDGSLFTLLEEKPISCPLIVISKTDQDAYKAIKMHATDYLVEPIDEREFLIAVQYALSHRHVKKLQSESGNTSKYKQRLLVKIGDKLKSINSKDVAYIYAEGKVAYVVSLSSNRKYIVDYSLDELEKAVLNPDYFFRINRKFIINIDAIDEVRSYANSRLKLTLSLPSEVDMIVSREKVVAFKSWMNY